MVDMNSLIPPGSGLILREGVYINEAGEIAAVADLENGDQHAVLLIPGESDGDESGSEMANESAAPSPHGSAERQRGSRPADSPRSWRPCARDSRTGHPTPDWDYRSRRTESQASGAERLRLCPGLFSRVANFTPSKALGRGTSWRRPTCV